ncbi:MAG: hypothetical protein KGK03_01920 [Candidatus Omnitrophica bacterium]|nr:hypothetical protein [Candidatus Omnitrophota bacterium]MDE2221806.1 hypothetical protein [Candidatus Omnitrophota bacterium]
MKITEQSEQLREHIAQHAKTFKLSWVQLAQGLYSVWRDKLYHAWEHEKFEDYCVRELGLKKPLALKLVKTYFFVEQEEPVYLKKEFAETRGTLNIPSYEGLDVLRLARGRKELTREDYTKLRKDIFEKGREATSVRKDLTAIIKERKAVDPQEEREQRHVQSVRRLVTALKTFKKDMETLKLGEPDLIEEAEGLLRRLEDASDDSRAH